MEQLCLHDLLVFLNKCLITEDIYQLTTSPNVQSTRVFNLPNMNYSTFKDVNSQNVKEKYEAMKGWRWSLEERDVEYFNFKEENFSSSWCPH